MKEGQDKSTVQDDNMAFLKMKFDPRTVLHSIAHTVHTHSRAQAVKCFFNSVMENGKWIKSYSLFSV